MQHSSHHHGLSHRLQFRLQPHPPNSQHAVDPLFLASLRQRCSVRRPQGNNSNPWRHAQWLPIDVNRIVIARFQCLCDGGSNRVRGIARGTRPQRRFLLDADGPKSTLPRLPSSSKLRLVRRTVDEFLPAAAEAAKTVDAITWCSKLSASSAAGKFSSADRLSPQLCNATPPSLRFRAIRFPDSATVLAAQIIAH